MKSFALVLCMAGLIGCACTASNTPCSSCSPQSEAEPQIRTMMLDSAQAWTDNDLDKFMLCYYNSPSLRFATPRGVTHGWQQVRDRYAKSIAKSDLEFSDLDITVLSEDAAVVFGRFHNHGKDGSEASGLFTLLVRKIDGRWVIVHDHSSDLPAEAKP